jgi:hypothetical protein
MPRPKLYDGAKTVSFYAEYLDESFLTSPKINLEDISQKISCPKAGPQWDTLRRSSSERLVQVRTKSHVGELISDMHAKDEGSIARARASLKIQRVT